jgi:Flp pilus assembly protein TadB
MDAIEQVREMDSETKAELQEVCDRVAHGLRDPNAVQKALERMNIMRETLRQRIGVQNIAVDLVRQSRA